jgi:hypothetical protein
MRLTEFLKEHRTVQQQAATIARLEKQVEALIAGECPNGDEQTAGGSGGK